MKKALTSIAILGSIFAFSAQGVAASNLYLVPSTQNPTQGDSFQVDVRLNTENDQINAVESNINYPANLEVESIDTNLPILAEQTVENNQIKLAQGSIEPIQGDIKVATITFKAKEAGDANLNFDQTSAVPSYVDSAETLNGTQSADLNVINPSANEAGPSATPAPQNQEDLTLNIVYLWTKIVTFFNS